MASPSRPGHARAFTATARTGHAQAEARWVVDRLPGAELLLVPGAGHYPQADSPERVNPTLISLAREAMSHA